MGETFDSYYRGGYMFQTSHSSSHNTGDHGRLLRLYVDSRGVSDILHENIRGDSRGDYGICGSRYPDISHSSFHNDGESVDGDGRSGYRSHTIPSPYHNSGELHRYLGFIFMVMREVDIGLRPANFLHITMVDYPLSTQCSLNKIYQGVYKDKIYIKIVLIIIIQAYHHN